ncbi:hypothetical protein E2C01_083198 [Portunus trituberculatus]|uniref:Uncharacterized protein n=1 Tax=Portunus trituberculatus TaxID=210409 RepID=A0A5B7J3V5_PORTR|nr:hypothetical protein [Portunus trituberculatus]
MLAGFAALESCLPTCIGDQRPTHTIRRYKSGVALQVWARQVCVPAVGVVQESMPLLPVIEQEVWLCVSFPRVSSTH